jgi:hypothetical protein
MPAYDIVCTREQGVDLIIVPLDEAFEGKTRAEQNATIVDLQRHARDAGLVGTVIPVWGSGGCLRFIAPPYWHPFFQTLSLRLVLSSINQTLSW